VRTLAEGATLRFLPTLGATGYRITVFDENRREVLVRETMAPELLLPAGSLQAGASYRWTVSVLGVDPSPPPASACFQTLDPETATRRTRLRDAVMAEGSSSALALLASCEQSLGLLEEARESFLAAQRLAPADEGLARALRELDQRIASEHDCPW
jgi:hypothetical protein